MQITDQILADLSDAAYSTPPRWQSGDVRAAWFGPGIAPDANIIAFRGTDPDKLADWVRDLDMWPTWRDGLGFCHRGFITGAEAVVADIVQDLKGAAPVITGHSLGGALALALAAKLAVIGYPVEAVVTFGAPRVGLWQFRNALCDIRVRQYCDADDPVPRVPRPYLHVRQPIIVGRPFLDPLEAHAMARYAERVPATVVA